MSSLYVEGLLNFRVRREKKVNENDRGDEQGEERICSLDQLERFFLTGKI